MERVRVSVPSAEAGEQFVSYTVAITRGPELAWSVSRRYQEFETLAAAVKR